MQRFIIWSLFIFGSLLLYSCAAKPKKVLIFSKTEGFRHASIEKGTKAISQFLESKGMQVIATEDAAYFTEDSLMQYGAVVFLNTTGNVLNGIQQVDFQRYIQAGGGFVGIHAATDTEYDWPWYNQLVGAYFDGHPSIQEASLNVINSDAPSCQHLPNPWTITEEWYNFKSINPAIEVLVEVDESTYEGGTNDGRHPMVWKHHYDGGRSFYTGIGHQIYTFSDPLYLQQVFAGIEFAIGDNRLDYLKVHTPRVPEENRFSKQVLDFNLDEPMELDELVDRGILYIERRGILKLYEYETETVKIIDSLDVHYDHEDGLLGLAVDPNYNENNWIYLFYSPNIAEAKQYVSRFTLEDDKLTDEKVLLEIPLIRQCCHSGGSLEFGKDGLLYIGVGDNTNPFESSGYAPIDERVGRQLYDAQRSAANTNDLRGKILRIKPESDGTYTIPERNLFPEGTENTRPEIYVMGSRNPFRFSIDSKTNYLYWGDVGPDAGSSDSLRGPKGMGEFNQAKVAGFYGWPYSRGNNQMYFDYDFNTMKSAELFDPDQIINNSPNNTGLQNLPPIQESMIWYSYNESKEFPWLRAGGVNPMSGPIYHESDYITSENSLPDYFENKWFVYEWMRDWIYVVHLDQNNQYVQADPFMPNTEFSHPMDMLFSKDGQLYILEYGQKWNSRNLDARLSVINYNSGNRPPIAKFDGDQEVGAAPLTVLFSANKSLDYDKDKLKYTWVFGEDIVTTDAPMAEYTFQNPGVYDVVLTVTDEEGESATASKKILAGNEPPKIKINLSDKNTAYWKNKKINYTVEVFDLEDGTTSDATIDPSKVKVTLNYIPEGEDIILASIGHQQNFEPKGLTLINASDCKACHAVNEKVAGPSYQDIAQRYTSEDKQKIIHRIIKGSRGIWGENMMAPHPQLKIEDVGVMVDYILSLDPDKQIDDHSLPLSGQIRFDQHLDDEVAGKYILMASYLDKGHPNVAGSALSVIEEITFNPLKIELEDAVDLDKELGIWGFMGRTVVGSIRDGKQIQLNPISLDNLSSVTIGGAFSKNYAYRSEVEIRSGSADGKLLGSGTIQYYDKEKNGFKTFEIDLDGGEGVHPLFLVFKNPENKDQYTMNGDWIQLNYSE